MGTLLMDPVLIDPVSVIAVGLLLSFVLLDAGRHKLQAPWRFAAVIENYRLLPPGSGRVAVWVVGSAEMLMGIGLLLPSSRTAALLLSAATLALYGMAIGINLARGRRSMDCGCGGADEKQGLSVGLLVRNGALASLAVAAAVCETLPRAVVWQDGLVAMSAATAGVILYLSANVLMVNRQLLVNLK